MARHASRSGRKRERSPKQRASRLPAHTRRFRSPRDPRRLEQVLLNRLTKAVISRRRAEGSPSRPPLGASVEVRVVDNGSGIDLAASSPLSSIASGRASTAKRTRNPVSDSACSSRVSWSKARVERFAPRARDLARVLPSSSRCRHEIEPTAGRRQSRRRVVRAPARETNPRLPRPAFRQAATGPSETGATRCELLPELASQLRLENEVDGLGQTRVTTVAGECRW